MPKGNFPKLKGSICNVPVNTSKIAEVLPQGADSTGLIIVKLKRKLSFKGHVYFQAVSPEAIKMALNYLKENNPLYKDISINISNIPNELVDLSEIETVEESNLEKNPLEENENPLDKFRFNSQETMLISRTPSSEEISIAQGEG